MKVLAILRSWRKIVGRSDSGAHRPRGAVSPPQRWHSFPAPQPAASPAPRQASHRPRGLSSPPLRWQPWSPSPSAAASAITRGQVETCHRSRGQPCPLPRWPSLTKRRRRPSALSCGHASGLVKPKIQCHRPRGDSGPPLRICIRSVTKLRSQTFQEHSRTRPHGTDEPPLRSRRRWNVFA